MQMLGIAVIGLDRLDQLLPALRGLGERHSGYGVTEEHYETVACALLWTLEQGLGEAFTLEVESAWISVYAMLANEMKAGAAKAKAVAAVA